MDDQLLPFNDGARRLGYHPQHVRRLIAAGKIRAPLRMHDGGRPYWTVRMISEIIAERMAIAKGGAK